MQIDAIKIDRKRYFSDTSTSTLVQRHFFWKKSPIKCTCWFKRLKHDQLFCDFFLQPLANQLMKSAKCSAVTRPLSFFLINTMIQSSQMTWQVFFHLEYFRQTAKALSLFSSQLSVSSMECARYWDLGSFVVDNVITGLCACSIVNKLLTWFHKWWISCQIIAFRGLKKYFAFENSWIEWQISSLSMSKKAYGFFGAYFEFGFQRLESDIACRIFKIEIRLYLAKRW